MVEDLTAPLMSFLHNGLTKEEIQNKGEKEMVTRWVCMYVRG